jgi:hypothetical protein
VIARRAREFLHCITITIPSATLSGYQLLLIDRVKIYLALGGRGRQLLRSLVELNLKLVGPNWRSLTHTNCDQYRHKDEVKCHFIIYLSTHKQGSIFR